MLIPTAEAARRLGCHPADVVYRVSELVGNLDDCWPSIDDGLVDTLRSLGGGWPATPVERPPRPRDQALAPGPALGVSPGAAVVLDKLERKKKWSEGTKVARRTLHNDFCKGVPNLDKALSELVEKGLLAAGSHDTYWLNLKNKAQIDRIVQTVRAKRA